MTKQEDIREGAILALMDYKGFDRAPTETIIDFVFNYLHVQEVMISSKETTYHLSNIVMEPLIDEDKG